MSVAAPGAGVVGNEVNAAVATNEPLQETTEVGEAPADANRGNVTEAVPIPPADEPSIESIVEQVVINPDGVCENLPTLKWQELKLIGRLVTFLGETVVNDERLFLHYEGYISMMSKGTVALLHVHRFTGEEFVERQEMREAMAKSSAKPKAKTNQGRSAAGTNNIVGEENIWGENGGRAVEVDDEEGDVLCSSPEGKQRRSLFLPLFYVNSLGRKVDADARSKVQKLVCGAESVGPIPYMTFGRSAIHGIVVCGDQRNSLMSIFRTSSKKYFDMQCLRMHVRRYLVSACKENKQQTMSLRTFVGNRGNCKDIDTNLLITVAKEELVHLMEVDRSIRRQHMRLSTSNPPSFGQNLPAPSGIFSATGILFFTRIPLQTFSLSVVQLLVTFMLLALSVNTIAATANPMAQEYVKLYMSSISVAGIQSLISGFVTGLHALRMRIPVVLGMHGMFRIISCTLSIGFNLMVLVTATRAVTYELILNYLTVKAEKPAELCQYYQENSCRGYGTSCVDDNSSSICLLETCPGPWVNPCTSVLNNAIVGIFMPFLVASMTLVVLSAFDHLFHYRLFRFSRIFALR
uniref:Uncharacterized protein n=1 Tax=Trypanosoma congolense (strain IL3000) TaxID=1068625 RepID=G0UKY3_TRYCI|nr:conserved hypothetical protein [Trypanosoma congolense IL3000]